MDEISSLSIEVVGFKATAMGTLPVSGLLLLMGLIVVTGFITGPAQIVRWARRLIQHSDK